MDSLHGRTDGVYIIRVMDIRRRPLATPTYMRTRNASRQIEWTTRKGTGAVLRPVVCSVPLRTQGHSSSGCGGMRATVAIRRMRCISASWFAVMNDFAIAGRIAPIGRGTMWVVSRRATDVMAGYCRSQL